MAFTGTPVVKRVSSSLVRITGVSLAPGASGTISCFPGTGEVKCDEEFHPTHYQDVTLQDSIELTHLPCVPISVAKSGVETSNFLFTLTNDLYFTTTNAPIVINNVVTNPTITLSGVGATPLLNMFFGLTAGTGNPGDPDYAATIAVGAAVPFPQAGPGNGNVTAGGVNQFVLPDAGTYRVSWAVDFLEASQLELDLNGTPVDNTCTTSGAGTQQNTNTVLIEAEAGDLLSLINPAGNAAALTVQTADGNLTHAQAPSLVIEFLPSTGGTPEAIATGTAVVSTATGGATSAPAATPELEIYIRHH